MLTIQTYTHSLWRSVHLKSPVVVTISIMFCLLVCESRTRAFVLFALSFLYKLNSFYQLCF